MLNLRTLKYRRIRGDMIELHKTITSKQDTDVTLKFNTIPVAVTRGNTHKIRQDHVRYDLCRFCFSNRVLTLLEKENLQRSVEQFTRYCS